LLLALVIGSALSLHLLVLLSTMLLLLPVQLALLLHLLLLLLLPLALCVCPFKANNRPHLLDLLVLLCQPPVHFWCDHAEECFGDHWGVGGEVLLELWHGGAQLVGNLLRDKRWHA
jgi:hypothetical protein